MRCPFSSTCCMRNSPAVPASVATRGGWISVLLDTRDDPPAPMTYGSAIAHVITHNMHHRAEILHMLGKLNVPDLPEGDVLTWEKQARG